MTPDTLLRLANLTVPRKPGRGPRIYPDPLANPTTAAQALGLARLGTAQLRTLRELHKTTVELVDALLDRRPLARPAARLTRLAEPSAATVRLDVGGGHSLHTRLQWSEPTLTATLARQVALELGEIDPQRLKRCALPACNLVFYDTTRPGTRRWHAESPCGARERQRRHRGRKHQLTHKAKLTRVLRDVRGRRNSARCPAPGSAIARRDGPGPRATTAGRRPREQ